MSTSFISSLHFAMPARASSSSFISRSPACARPRTPFKTAVPTSIKAQLQPEQSDVNSSNDTTPEEIAPDANEATASDSPFADDDSWFSIAQPIAKPDTGSPPPHAFNSPDSKDHVVDLLALENAGRQVLAKGSYESVVDVDVDQGGVFENDEDNSDLLSGVGFDALLDSEVLLENLRSNFGIETATHVQLAAIPRIQDRSDLVMQSYTGTGKTLAFLLPILEEMDDSASITQAMIVAPTRELAMQIFRECDRLIANTNVSNLALIGGANPLRQVEKLRRNTPHIVVGTPGRLAELAENGDLKVRKLQTLVVDEVDQCLVGQFGEQVHRLLKVIPSETQKVLVSATGDVDSVRQFAGSALDDPVLLRVVGKLRIPRNISHWSCIVPGRMKIETVRKIIFCNPTPDRAIVFVDDPRRVDLVSERLYQMRIAVGSLRGNADKMERKETLEAFRKGRVQVLVSTEVAARGLDVPEISHVINLDLPTDTDHYVHRAGRCGRAGKPGTVVSIATGEHAFVIRRMSKEMGLNIQRMEPRGGEYREPIEREAGVGKQRADRQKREGIATRRVEKVGEKPNPKPILSERSTERSTEETKVDSTEVKAQDGKKKDKKRTKNRHRKGDTSAGSSSEAKVGSKGLRGGIRAKAKMQGWVGNRS